LLTANRDEVVPESEKLFMEGRIVQKLECRPYADKMYMQMKLDSIKKASQPARQVKPLEKIVHNFKPVSDHKHNVRRIWTFYHKIVLIIPFFLYSLKIRSARRPRVKSPVTIKTLFSTCFSMLSRSTSITTSRTWLKLLGSPFVI
jgi:hypothetical protein